MAFLGNLLKGTQGLGKTFWLYFVAVPVVLAVLFYGAAFLTLGFASPLFRLLDLGFMAFIAIWEVLTGIAVLRAATHERTRGLWGWTATVVAVLGIAGTLVRIGNAGLAVVNPPQITAEDQWRALQDRVRADQAALPKAFSDGRTLTASTLDARGRALTYTFDVAALTIPDPAAYARKLKAEEVARCAEHEPAFTAGVTMVHLIHKAKDQSLAEYSLVPKDCGVTVASVAPAADAPPPNDNAEIPAPKDAEVPPPAKEAEAAPPAAGSDAGPEGGTGQTGRTRLDLAAIRKAIDTDGDDKVAIKPVVAQLRTMAGKGDTVAQVYLGDLYLKGHKVIRNYPMAAYWYEQAAKKGNSEAQFKLAGMYRDNIGVVQTGEAAQDWLIRAAAAGHVKARRLLGEWGIKPPPVKPVKPMAPKKKKKKDGDGDAE